ncbi:hypothetical protein [Aminobacter sp. AP02]|uniref:hypothetical protein n=1 Tax=Aminobacter sp. AP02 TaxID=2135737 RepID=UPI000D6C9EF6|nr:hypothetical protein [Aminobacter sp. AP02]PWK66951.1 hypothetical protein C8K44_11367 [Aminobacter sp. AP02]
MPKTTIHPADQADLIAIAQATHFVVHMRRGPADVFKQEAPTLPDAIDIAEQIRAENKGRDCLVYAITPEGNSIPVPKAMQRVTGADAAIPDIGRAMRERRAMAADGRGKKAICPTAPRRAAGKVNDAAPKARRAEITENAAKGILPPVPDFSAPTHARFRKKLTNIVALAKAGDIEGLKAIDINPVSSSPKAMIRYRDLAVVALQARAGA